MINKDILKKITPEVLDRMSIEQRVEFNKLLNELKERRKKYPILDFKLHDFQQEFADALSARKDD